MDGKSKAWRKTSINDDDLIGFRGDVGGDIRFDDSVVDGRPEDVR